MDLFRSFFDRYRKLVPADRAAKIAVQRALKEVLGTTVELDAINVRHCRARVNGSPALKTSMKLAERTLLAAANRELQGVAPLTAIY